MAILGRKHYQGNYNGETGEGNKKDGGVTDGARTHDNRNHNPGLYRLSYSHHRNNELPG